MELSPKPSRPVVPSQAAAAQQFAGWLDSARRQFVPDQEGHQWRVCSEFRLREGGQGWQAILWLELECSMQDLLEQKVFDLNGDKRTIDLLKGKVPAIKLRPRRVEAGSMDECILKLKEAVIGMQEAIGSVDTRTVKRNVVFEWLDRSLAFGSELRHGERG